MNAIYRYIAVSAVALGISLAFSPVLAYAGRCGGGSIIYVLDRQESEQINVMVDGTGFELRVFDDPGPATYTYYMCLCNLRVHGTICNWGSGKSSQPTGDHTDPGCGWLSGNHSDPNACELVGEECHWP